MKKYQFQGYDIELKKFVVGFVKGDFHDGSIVLGCTSDEFDTYEESERYLVPETVGRYARPDTNGVDIYEHDLVQIQDKETGIFNPTIWQVAYDTDICMFSLECEESKLDNTKCEIFGYPFYNYYKVGNAFDNVAAEMAKKYE